MTVRISRLADFLPYLLSVTSNAVSGRIADEYQKQFGVRIPEWRVMAVLGDAGALTQRDLVGATLMDKVAVNRACKWLEAHGLIRRSPNTTDGRSHLLELTPAGRELHSGIIPLALDMEERLFAVLDAPERDSFKSMLERLRDRARTLQPSAHLASRQALDSEAA